MNNKTLTHELIQTSSSLYELNKIKKDCDKTYMVTYQVGDLIKAGLHLREGFMGSDPCLVSRKTKLFPQYLYQVKVSI